MIGKKRAILQYSLKKYTWPSILVFAFVVIITLLFSTYSELKNHKVMTNVFEPVLSITGTIAPILVWLYFMGKEWKEDLPHKLIVHFFIKEKNESKSYVMSIYNANVLQNGDIRSLGQQLGAQMAKVGRLKFSPSIHPIVDKELLRIVQSDNRHGWIQYTETEFLLDELPGGFERDCEYRVWKIDEMGKSELILRQCLSIPFHQYKMSLDSLLSSNRTSFEEFERINLLKCEVKAGGPCEVNDEESNAAADATPADNENLKTAEAKSSDNDASTQA